MKVCRLCKTRFEPVRPLQAVCSVECSRQWANTDAARRREKAARAAARREARGRLETPSQAETTGAGAVFTTEAKENNQMASFNPTPPNTPTSWLCHVLIDNREAAIERTKRMGGKVLMDKIDVPNMGHFAVLMDPTGGVFSVFQATPMT